jgi:hypothetical protein
LSIQYASETAVANAGGRATTYGVHRIAGKVEGPEPFRLPNKGTTMGNKSPQKSMTKKSGKSIKEKRADKRLAASASSAPPIVPMKKP